MPHIIWLLWDIRSVSYTHLTAKSKEKGVIKNSAYQAFLSAIQSDNQKLSQQYLGDWKDLRLNLNAVSYTHLDVYKRQEFAHFNDDVLDGNATEETLDVIRLTAEGIYYLSLIHISALKKNMRNKIMSWSIM